MAAAPGKSAAAAAAAAAAAQRPPAAAAQAPVQLPHPAAPPAHLAAFAALLAALLAARLAAACLRCGCGHSSWVQPQQPECLRLLRCPAAASSAAGQPPRQPPPHSAPAGSPGPHLLPGLQRRLASGSPESAACQLEAVLPPPPPCARRPHPSCARRSACSRWRWRGEPCPSPCRQLLQAGARPAAGRSRGAPLLLPPPLRPLLVPLLAVTETPRRPSRR